MAFDLAAVQADPSIKEVPLEGAACGDTVTGVGSDVLVTIDEIQMPVSVGFFYFQERPVLQLRATEERLSVTTLAGFDVLIDRPVHEVIPGCHLYAVVRPSSPDQLGIAMGVLGGIFCEQALELGERLLTLNADRLNAGIGTLE